eukprot:jgi/Astpho2/6590/e_gw1.00101.152.1_t
MAWAAAANKQPVKEQPTIFILPSGQSVAVVDANAIIAGVQLHTLGERLMTIPEVMGEIRDVRSRQAVAFAAVPLVQQDPAEEDPALSTVTRFARATGDLHSLSTADIKLIALARTLEVGFQSSVVCVTGDFAMQNVILQMGLRLAAPTGQQIDRLARWALRCTACFKICKEPGRLFCPHCGNATLEKVEMIVGADGEEQFGVRKRHNLRGTRFSLPKPRGGHRRQPILREDMLLQKMRRRDRKPPPETDAFAPEFGAESWHLRNNVSSRAYKGAAAQLAGWKHNPNERQHVRTNRRK